MFCHRILANIPLKFHCMEKKMVHTLSPANMIKIWRKEQTNARFSFRILFAPNKKKKRTRGCARLKESLLEWSQMWFHICSLSAIVGLCQRSFQAENAKLGVHNGNLPGVQGGGCNNSVGMLKEVQSIMIIIWDMLFLVYREKGVWQLFWRSKGVCGGKQCSPDPFPKCGCSLTHP